MNRRGLRRITLVVVVCAFAGALAGIAGSAAAPTKKSAATAAQKKAFAIAKAKARAQKKALRRGFRFGFGPGPGGPGGPMGGPVHTEAVVPNADGTDFDKVTSDNGTLNSAVDGTTVHLKEASDKATYDADVAIDVGTDAKVFRNHAAAKLSDLKPGDHVHVLKGPKGSVVIAEDDAFLAQEKKDHPRFGFRHKRFDHDGPPPPGAPGGYPGDQGPNENGSTTSGSGSTGSNS